MTAFTNAPTLGWDLVYAVESGALNEQLAKTMTPLQVEGALDTMSLTADAIKWSIVPGGSGPVLYIQLDLANGMLKDDAQLLPFSANIVVDVQLSSFTQGERLDFKVIMASEAPFTVQSSVITPAISLLHQSFIETAVQRWLRANPKYFSQVLAQIDMTPMESQLAHSWLRPTLVSYAWTDRPGKGDGVLALLAMTNGRDKPVHDNQVCATAIPEGDHAAILISPHLLLDWIIRPAMGAAYKLADLDALKLEDAPPVLRLSEPQQIPPVTDNGKNYPATLNTLSIAFTGNELQCASEVCVDKGELSEYTAVRSRHKLAVEPDAEGKPSVCFVEIVPPEMEQSTEMKESFIREARNKATATLLIGSALAFMIGGPIAVTIMLVSATTSGIFAATPAIAYYLDKTEPHPVDLLCLNATRAFNWHGGEQFFLRSVSLVESFCLSGSPWEETR